jgi:deoxyribodipyrimidine photo-lyase
MNDVGSGGIDVSGFLEELIVRRELAFNFVYYNSNYDKFECLPNWARVSLGKHREDVREYLYSLEELESARTYDVYWNSAQRELVGSGVMHNYMRMYWGKKILEWSPTPEVAFANALYLNNKYSLDGFDPNSFAGVAWCFGKHDRPWRERSIFGMVRFMNDKGLVRKFKMGPYLEKWK